MLGKAHCCDSIALIMDNPFFVVSVCLNHYRLTNEMQMLTGIDWLSIRLTKLGKILWKHCIFCDIPTDSEVCVACKNQLKVEIKNWVKHESKNKK